MRTDDHYDNNLTRPEIIELCKRLGHDPTHVSRITIEPNSITVIDECHPRDHPHPLPPGTHTGEPSVTESDSSRSHLSPPQLARVEALQFSRHVQVRSDLTAASGPDVVDLVTVARFILDGNDPWQAKSVTINASELDDDES